MLLKFLHIYNVITKKSYIYPPFRWAVEYADCTSVDG